MIERVDETYQAKWVPGLTDEDYHNDLTALARGDFLAIEKSPQSWLAYRRSKLNPDPSKKEPPPFRIGRAVHAKLLEPARFDQMLIQMPDFGDMRSSKNREKRDAWTKEQPPGAFLLKEAEHRMILGMVESFMRHEIAEKIFSAQSVVEEACYYRDPTTGYKRRVKPDFVSEFFNAIVDFKSTTDVSIDHFTRALWDYRYAFQSAFYLEAVAKAVPWPVVNSIIVAVEKAEPHEVAVYVVNDAAIEFEQESVRLLAERIQRCMTSGRFESYQQRAEDISLPYYVFQRADEYHESLRR